jgi:mRNA-degrading endonuclease RelE of RelBE toxin-antitoxin system
MNFSIVYTDHFERELKRLSKKYKSIREDLEVLISDLEINPIQGQPLGKDCYKIRIAIASKGKGKSGGARVIIHVFISGKLVYLLSVYDKSQQDNISDNEILNLLKFLR